LRQKGNIQDRGCRRSREGHHLMENDAITRLRQHADLVQRLVKQIPAALGRPGLTLDQVSRLHAVVEKGVRDFGEVRRRVDGPDTNESYRRAAGSLAGIWEHLEAAVSARMEELRQRSEPENTGADD
ncbi:MAG: hypothetical protein ACRECY_11575, partial [Phyllobacterium sp.]